MNEEMSAVEFYIDGKPRQFSVDPSVPFVFGNDEVLAKRETDIVFGQSWYDSGYTEVGLLSDEEFAVLRSGLERSVRKIIEDEIGCALDGFRLQDYHRFVKSGDQHAKVVKRTSDLFPDDFSFPIEELLPRLGHALNLKLSDVDPGTGDKMHIIVRINRPGSNDYNPPHKDVYEDWDNRGVISQFVNFWIPIFGVTPNSSLPLVPGSHRLNENEILRTRVGGSMSGNKYRVRAIRSWGGRTELSRSKVQYGEALVFSSHLIHGLGCNDEMDSTRVALEFRLFKAK